MKTLKNTPLTLSRSVTKLFAVIALSLLTTACVDFSPGALQGKYLGTWSKAGVTELIPVNAIITPDSKKSMTVNLKCTDSKKPCQFELDIERPKKTLAQVSISGEAQASLDLSYDSSDSSKERPCLSDDSGGEMCISDDQILVTFIDQAGAKNTFSLTRVNDVADVVRSEVPHEYTLPELLDLAANYDFSTRIEYQRYLQTRYNAKATLLAQLPHVNIGTVGNLLGGLNPASLISVVGDLLPFLLPNRWMQVKEASLTSKAEQLSVAVIRLNAVLFTETATYSYFRDVKTIAKLADERKSILGIYDELKMREGLGQLVYGTSQDIAAVLNAIDQAQLQLNQNVANDLLAIGLSVGFSNPRAVKSVTFTNPRDIKSPMTIDEDQLESLAMQNSHEIQQADYLYRAAKVQRVEKYFSWLDPSAAPQLSIGAALFPAGKSASAQVSEFQGIKDQIVASTLNRAASLHTSLDFAIKNQTLANQANTIQGERVKRILSQLEYGANFVLADLVNALQDQVSATVNDMGNQALYQITEAQIDRLLLRGIYGRYDQSNVISVP